MRKAFQIWGDFFYILRRHPIIIFPFVLISLCNALALYLVYLAPQRPVSLVLAPPIKVFFGERFLHYPLNLVLLPKLFYYAQIAVSILLGIVLSAFAVRLVARGYKDIKGSLLLDLISVCRRYFAVLTVWLVPFILGAAAVKLLSRFAPSSGIIQILFAMAVFIFTMFFQLAVIYMVPALVAGQKNLFAAWQINVRMLKNNFVATLFLVMVPVLFYLPVLWLKVKAVYMMSRFFPEIVLLILVVSIAVMFVIDLMIVGATSLFYLKERK